MRSNLNMLWDEIWENALIESVNLNNAHLSKLVLNILFIKKKVHDWFLLGGSTCVYCLPYHMAEHHLLHNSYVHSQLIIQLPFFAPTNFSLHHAEIIWMNFVTRDLLQGITSYMKWFSPWRINFLSP